MHRTVVKKFGELEKQVSGCCWYMQKSLIFSRKSFKIALCDELYKVSLLNNRGELERLLFEDLRINEDEFLRLNMPDLIEIATRFHTQNHRLLQSYVKRRM